MKHGLIHIPSGSSIVLPYTQWHARHYGTQENFCSHGILFTGNWHGTVLRFIDATILKECKDKVDEVMAKLEDDLYSKDIEDKMREAREKNGSRQEKGYENSFKKLSIDGSFHVLLNNAHPKYFSM